MLPRLNRAREARSRRRRRRGRDAGTPTPIHGPVTFTESDCRLTVVGDNAGGFVGFTGMTIDEAITALERGARKGARHG